MADKMSPFVLIFNKNHNLEKMSLKINKLYVFLELIFILSNVYECMNDIG